MKNKLQRLKSTKRRSTRFLKQILIFGIVLLLLGICVLEPIVISLYSKEEYKILEEKARFIEKNINENKSVKEKTYNRLIMMNGTPYFLGEYEEELKAFLSKHPLKTLKTYGKINLLKGEYIMYYKIPIKDGYIFTYSSIHETRKIKASLMIIIFLIFISVLILSIPFSYILSKIQEKRREKEKKMAADLFHDFKAPLAVIRSYSEGLHDGVIKSENIKEYTDEILTEVDRLSQMTYELLNLSNIEGNPKKLTIEEIELCSFSRRIAYNLSKVYEKEVIFETNKEKINILGNPPLIERTIYNLIDNAFKFTRDKIIIRIIENNKNVLFEVEDFGEGINKKDLNKIWDPYFKNKESRGQGLGLAICDEVLDKHNFKHGVESEVGKGSIFYFIAPIKK